MLALRSDAGHRLSLDAVRWHGQLTPAERRLLAGLAAPVLDVGCGPGRVVSALADLGVPVLGIEPVASAVAMARRRGAAVLQRSVFEDLPGTGRWKSVVLLDGNVGIGGDPVRLLARCRELIAPDGVVVAEVEAPGRSSGTHRVRFERDGWHGPWFHWSVVAIDALRPFASSAGLAVRRVARDAHEDRWFAFLAHEAHGGNG